jgi:molecular chaperone GrpE
MSDTEQTIGRSADEQPDSRGADAPRGAGEKSGEGRAAERGPADAEAGANDAHAGAPGDGNGEAAEIEDELDELVQTAAERDEYLALAQRTQADFENYRKRVAREAVNAKGRGIATLAKELFPALDNLDRALAAAAQDDPLLEGVRLVRCELADALARVGVEAFSPVGEAFDPALHEAMATTGEPVEGAESGTVVEVYQPGYRLGTSIIRPARVLVAA